mmetsp:Transcript_23471/g.50842  ORF Transcript_23471/g.50842 Transcript_23471/m.50842 type:complete len:80 (-) Transcript_23471:360-599(-)
MEHDASPFDKSATLKNLSLEDKKKRDESANLVHHYVAEYNPDRKFDQAHTPQGLMIEDRENKNETKEMHGRYEHEQDTD